MIIIPAGTIVERRLDGLRELFENCEDTLYLRGSYVRGDNYCNDIDISAYNETGIIHMPNPPQEFNGLKINYGGIARQDFENYFAICPRGGSSMMEMQPLTIGSSIIPNTLQQQLRQYLNSRIPNYLLFLLVEEETNGRIADRSQGDDYFTLKRHRGGKRTISRIIWGSKAMQFDSLFLLSHEEVLNKLVNHKQMPEKVADSCRFILRSTHLNHGSDIWKAHTAHISLWYQREYSPSIIKYLQDYMNHNVITYFLVSAMANTAIPNLHLAYELSKKLEGQLRWIMLFALSGNWKLPRKYLEEIWHEFKYDQTYRNIIRNLIANPALPDNLIDPVELSTNKLMLRAYNIRTILKLNFR